MTGAFCLAFSGVCAMAMSMRRHMDALPGNTWLRAHQMTMRVIAWALMLAAAPACMQLWRWPEALVAWIFLLGVAAAALALLLACRPGWIWRAAGLSLALGVVNVIVAMAH